MRPIKFRAWDGDRKEMQREAGYLQFDGWGLVAIFWEDEGEWSTDVKNVIALQYTGLKDKDGTEIYLGDLVKFDHRGVSEVVETCNGFGLKGTQSQRTYQLTAFVEEVDVDDMRLDSCVVIGNIYN